MQSNKMLSEAGKSYDKTKVPNPYSTRQRFRYYQREPVESTTKIPKPYQTLDSNLRNQRDSFVLRHTLETVVTTNHNPNFDSTLPSQPSQVFAKGKFERYIGEVKQLDFSQPLRENCDHRCAHANNIIATPTEIFPGDGELDLPVVSSKDIKKPTLLNSDAYSSQKLRLSELKSTEHSLMNKRSKLTIELGRSEEKKQKFYKARGVSFDSSLGHQYLREVERREPNPEFYDIESCRQSYLKKSMKEPSIYVNFPQYRNSIATRYDRSDPNWHTYMDNAGGLKEKDLSYSFDMNSQRKPNQVLSKYPYRQNMNFYIFPPKAAPLRQNLELDLPIQQCSN